MALLYLFDPVVVHLSTSLDLVIWDIIGPVALTALGFLSFKGFQLHRKLLQLVPGVKNTLSFENSLLHCQVEHKKKSVDLSGLWVRRHLLLEHVDPVNQLVHRLVTPRVDALVILEHILKTDIRRAQVIKKNHLNSSQV